VAMIKSKTVESEYSAEAAHVLERGRSAKVVVLDGPACEWRLYDLLSR
jgi:hypothetical protein